MRYLFQVENIRFIELLNDELFYVTKSDAVFLIKQKDSCFLLDTNNIQSLGYLEDCLLINNKILYKDGNLIPLTKDSKISLSGLKVDNFQIFYQSNWPKETKFGIIQPNSDLKFVDEINNAKYVFSDLVITIEDFNLQCVKFKTLECLWQLNILSISKLETIEICNFHFSHNKIITSLVSGNIVKTLVLNIETGKVLFEQADFGGYTYLYQNKVYTVFNKRICYLDLETYKFEVIEITDTVFLEKDFFINYSRSFFANNKLYFSACSGRGNMDSYVGIIDLKTYKLEWYNEILKNPKKAPSPANSRMITEIKANENQLYVLVAGSTLYVFEKEN